MIELTDIHKTYKRGTETVRALRGIDLAVGRGEFISVVGQSGSGKTTLLHILGCMDKPTSGDIRIDGQHAQNMTDEDLVKLRRLKIGFVFQQFYLIEGLSVYENVVLPLVFARKKKAKDEILAALALVGLEKRINHRPDQLSGGEMQRVAIARSLVNSPEIILADEPTGNLDSVNSENIFEIFKSLHSKGISVVIVTHNNELAARTERIIRIKDGQITS
jgi:ABC-type lipoprotein export system ATPase subunit